MKSAEEIGTTANEEILAEALSWVGTPYRHPSGCSSATASGLPAQLSNCCGRSGAIRSLSISGGRLPFAYKNLASSVEKYSRVIRSPWHAPDLAFRSRRRHIGIGCLSNRYRGREISMSGKALTQAVAYLRTSSAANVGSDKDSERRQLDAIETFAKGGGYEIVTTFSDAAISGGDAVTARPGFSAMLERLLSNGVRTILVETASRFARDLIVQETGYEMLKARGIELIAVDSPDSFVADTPTANLIRQVLGAVSEFEKAMLVEKLQRCPGT